MEKEIVWTPNLAYAIGLIVSDGHLQKDGRHICLTSKDFEQISNFSKALNISNRVTRIGSGRNKLKPYYRIRFSSTALYKFLVNIGVTPTKSHTIGQILVPDKFIYDFTRGVFDGDGSFYYNYDKRWKNCMVYQIAFYSASLEFITWLKSKLAIHCDVKGFTRKGKGVWMLRYVKSDTRKLYKTMYYDPNVLCLKRKYVKISNAIYLNAPVAQWFRADA